MGTGKPNVRMGDFLLSPTICSRDRPHEICDCRVVGRWHKTFHSKVVQEWIAQPKQSFANSCLDFGLESCSDDDWLARCRPQRFDHPQLLGDSRLLTQHVAIDRGAVDFSFSDHPHRRFVESSLNDLTEEVP